MASDHKYLSCHCNIAQFIVKSKKSQYQQLLEEAGKFKNYIEVVLIMLHLQNNKVNILGQIYNQKTIRAYNVLKKTVSDK